MNIPLLNLQDYHTSIRSEVISEIEACYDANAFCLGPHVEEFEEALSQYTGSPHAIGVNSGTSALHLALLALGIHNGDEVIVPAMTFISTAWAVCYCGALPIFADVEIDSRTLSMESVESLITKKTKAIIAVHLYGQPAKMDALRKICDDNGLMLIEDAAQALGATYDKKPIGSWGEITCLSFYPGKNLGGIGEGGAALTHDKALAEKIRSLRNHGTTSNRYIHESIGYNYRMDGIQAAALNVKIKAYNVRQRQRQAIASQYQTLLSQENQIKIPIVPNNIQSAWHLYVILVEDRNRVAEKLKKDGISTGLHYPTPLHLQPCFKELGYLKGCLPNTEYIANSCLSLPMFPELTKIEVEYVCERLVGLKIETINQHA